MFYRRWAVFAVIFLLAGFLGGINARTVDDAGLTEGSGESRLTSLEFGFASDEAMSLVEDSARSDSSTTAEAAEKAEAAMEASASAQEDAPEAGSESGPSLAEMARDPTAPITAFQMIYSRVASFHKVSNATQDSFHLMPIIPLKFGNRTHVARVSAGYIFNAPDFSELGELPPNVAPPYQLSKKGHSGFQDTVIVDLAMFPQSFGRIGVGGVISIPTGSKDLGTGKWSIGPAFVMMFKKGGFTGGFLMQGFFSVAGKKDRPKVDIVNLQPFGSFGLPNNWSIGLSDIIFNYDTRRGQWTSVPFGVRLEKFVNFGKKGARVYVEVQYGFLHNQTTPKWNYKVCFCPLL